MPTKSFEELKATGALPSPPGVGMEILRISQNENCSVDELAKVIQSDPAITGRLLQVANSALAGGTRPCTTMKEATMRLGLRSVRSVALGFSLVSAHRNGQCTSFDYGVFWSQSLARAVAAHVLSARFRIGVPAEVFVAALLSDLGSLALATVHPRIYSEILTAPESTTANGRAVLESQKFGIDHREVTAAILREWKLPEPFALAAQSVGAVEPIPADPRRGPTLTQLVWIAARFASAFIVPDDKPLDVERVQKALAQLPGWIADQLPALWAEMAEGWRRWGTLLEIVTTAVPPYGSGMPTKARIGNPLLATAASGAASRNATTAPTAADGSAKTPAAPVPAPATPSDPPASHARILAVDDDNASLKMLTSLLTRAGHQVTQSANGREALKVAMQSVPQIVVADRHMPEMDGVQLCKSLRQFEAGRRVYMIVLTADESEDHIVEAFDAGVDDYVVKPFKPKLLLARVRAGMRVVRMQERIDADKATMQRQVAEMGVLARRLQQAAITDVLTDLPNRRYAIDALRECWEKSTREDDTLSAVMVDVDKFKRVNDTYGHDAGDVVLKDVAKILRAQVEPPASVCRLGGEEFVVILPGIGADGARENAERLRLAIEKHRVVVGKFDGRVTASFGVATRDATVRDGEHLLKLADEGLYLAKEGGRNQVRTVQSSQTPVEPLAPKR
jgi:diguanylate cyclase (GGDEF)-like protein